MDTDSIRLFLRIADLGGVSAAANDLSLSPASASARLSKLEQQLGFRLFNRTTRAVSLTTDGAEFLPFAQQSLETLDAGQSAISGQGAAARGLLRMTMPGSFGRLHVVPRLAKFCEQHPAVSLDLRLSDEVLDVVEGAYDLIIRNAPLEDSTLVARKLAADRRLLVASPSYLSAFGAPQSIGDLKHHRAIVLSDNTQWKFADGQSFRVTGMVSVNDGEALKDLIASGLGIGIQSQWLASALLRSGDLVPVLREHPLAVESAIWALYPSNRIVAPKVRAMIDFLQREFQPRPPWEIEGNKPS